MSEDVTVALIIAIPPTIIGLLNALLSWKHGAKLEQYHVQINSRMDQLLVTTAAESHAKGLAEGKSEGQDRQK